MAVEEPPRAPLPPKDACDAQSHRPEILRAANFSAVVLHLNEIGQVWCHLFGDGLESRGIAIPIEVRSSPGGLGNLPFPPRDSSKRVSQSYLGMIREQSENWLRVTRLKSAQRLVVLLQNRLESRALHNIHLAFCRQISMNHIHRSGDML